MLENSEGRFVSRVFMLNFTSSPVNITFDEGNGMLGYIKIFSILPVFWLKAIPSITYGIGVVSNPILATYLIKYKRYRSPIFGIILSMCFADTMMCASALLWTLVRLPFLIGPAWLCPFGEEVLYTSIVSSIYHMLIISIVRFYQLVFPLSARAKVTSGVMAKICIGVWVFSISNSIPFAIASAPVSAEYEGNVYRLCSLTGGYFIAMNFYVGIVIFIGPFMLIAAFHTAKHFIVLNVGIASTSSMTKDEQKRGTTDTRALMIVITVYLVTAGPVTVSCFLLALNVDFNPLISNTVYKIQWLNSALNPFIYACAAQSERRDVLRMLRCPTDFGP